MESDITVSDLEIMSSAVRYRRWLLRQVEPYLGRRVLEVGAGIGNYTEFLLDRDSVVCLELHPEAASYLRTRFSGHANVHVVEGDIARPDMRMLTARRCDTVLCFNVLEHIEDDGLALDNMREVLAPGGRLALIVPALPAIMGTVDRALGHYRRYTRGTLGPLLARQGFRVERLHYMNILGILGWYWNNRIAHRSAESPRQILFYSRFVVPWLSALEALRPPPIGLSLVCIAHRSDSARAQSPPAAHFVS